VPLPLAIGTHPIRTRFTAVSQTLLLHMKSADLFIAGWKGRCHNSAFELAVLLSYERNGISLFSNNSLLF
jgi:hypothetical protein